MGIFHSAIAMLCIGTQGLSAPVGGHHKDGLLLTPCSTT